MKVEGFTDAEIDAFMSGKPPPASSTESKQEAVDPRFEKYEKMKKMLPEPAIKQKMTMDGFTQQEIDAFFNGGAPKSALKSPLNKTKSGKIVSFNAGDAKPAAVTPPAPPPRKPKYNVKMKNIYWNKLSETEVKTTLWKDIKQYELNEGIRKDLEEWFAAKAAKDMASIATAALAVVKLEKKIPKAVSLLDGKKTQNTLIALGKLKKTPVEIASMIMDMDPAVLTLDVTTTLLAVFPTVEEMASIKDYPEPDQLDKASRFVYEICKVPNVLQRLNTQEIIFNWSSNAKSVSDQISLLLKACDELSKSKSSIETILSIVLSIGNYMNDCTRFGDALGIKINSLLSLQTMKATLNQQNNLLNFIALVISKQYPDLWKFTENYIALWGASELSFTQIVNDLASVEKHVVRLSEEFKKLKDAKTNGTTNPLYTRLEVFLMSGIIIRSSRFECM